jgi:hypothetical protein
MILINLEEDKIFEKVINTQVVVREPNFVLFKYKKIMSFIFFVACLLNIILYSSKVYKFKREEMGFLKIQVGVTLISLCVYNIVYSFEQSDTTLVNFFDSFVNAFMTS